MENIKRLTEKIEYNNIDIFILIRSSNYRIYSCITLEIIFESKNSIKYNNKTGVGKNDRTKTKLNINNKYRSIEVLDIL